MTTLKLLLKFNFDLNNKNIQMIQHFLFKSTEDSSINLRLCNRKHIFYLINYYCKIETTSK